jgi:hypothetical protein
VRSHPQVSGDGDGDGDGDEPDPEEGEGAGDAADMAEATILGIADIIDGMGAAETSG